MTSGVFVFGQQGTEAGQRLSGTLGITLCGMLVP
jgi:hypothetical protein